ncbi:AraC family transcriptional regulator [Diaminobutyricimonas sp. LJ205]|uniref:AraC family transcriptional regulator n=1 Tax=Diaminobutyricimonas sp. LJ205 TaxID=2683590 RepID=UPI0012F48D30|nr:AraC family transcriptional regulator [Diaminobutyricimonas sp. LJ205]
MSAHPMLTPLTTAAETQRFSTSTVPVDRRLASWEEYNEQVLFGLRASTLSDDGLLATQSNLDLHRLRFTEIIGNNHVIERTPRNIAAKPVDAVMLCLLLKGNAFLYHADGCDPVRAGDAVLYDADRPFMYGFSSNMHQLILELPRNVFHGSIGEEGVVRPRVLHLADSQVAQGWVRAAAKSMHDAIRQPSLASPDLEDSLIDLHALMLGHGASATGSGYVLAAREFVRAHLNETDLSTARIARAVGVSERHLARVFADEGLTVATYVMDQRMSRARDILGDQSRQTLAISEVAAAVGFVSAAHFARVFKARFDCNPREARDAFLR